MATHDFLAQNRRAWDERVRQRQHHARPVTGREFENPAPILDPRGWIGGDLAGQRVLCLAAGGGRHGVLFAARGARVTVVDLSPQMLALDAQLAAERGLTLRLVETSMDNLSMLDEAAFDLVIQPVSTCYVPDIAAVYREVARVTAPGGLYLSQHKQPASLQAELRSTSGGCVLNVPYYRTGPLPPAPRDCEHRELGTAEFLHRWEQILGELCRSGFAIEDVAEPHHAEPHAEPGTFGHRCNFLEPFITLKARRNQQPAPGAARGKIWTP
ncbi:MAG: class I SAM-dependent methyltransferase [Verrucomicrobia bacterium]|nr:class I SAM-dependent methyltransferase [Verrucomicrobiota bacterium]